jgi:hypothetical protein
MKRFLTTGILAITLTLTGCQTMGMGPKRPLFFPNEAYQRNGDMRAQRDSEYCMSLADEYIQQPNAYWDAAKQGVVGGAVGAGTGALGGTIMGAKVGRATAAGAAIGATIGVLRSVMESTEQSPSYQRFVEHCLQKKGYEVVGWGSGGGRY